MANGLLPAPYWSWISAGMHNTLTHYSHYTDDAQYDAQVAAGIQAQAGSGDFSGPNIPGNDDQLWWGLSAMTQAEFAPSPDAWPSLAKNVFATVITRWQTTGSCTNNLGGIGWQIDPQNPNGGYHYMNAITNGLAFQLAARLARYTGEQYYIDQANKIFEWSWAVGIIDHKTYSVYDGTHAPDCSSMDPTQWSYNNGVYLYGAAIMLEHTGNPEWQTHLDAFLSATHREFAPNNLLTEHCDADHSCNTDQSTFKAYLARWLGQTAALIPSTRDSIMPILQASADAVSQGRFGGDQGDVGAEMSRLEITQAVLATRRALPMRMEAGVSRL
ncbi:glycoside hydrolase family 76 protein [Pseudocercospora fijiensis CIRAD86]|uniref:mannan endo-1,6-alpha-mannosidase n=1 Tax=Pseudocercospora fijiensis (strain CIRAD86) TaxID=383855 RepID=M3AFM4_PSEFD|nr:glycoside hydrolase family 76 protein [Pseudocercospora fijiensis CIRAD86]EME83396.1 glycoside hydrolase family 76 protein [Pseudocercospora fijiensis CIRAD86]